MVAPPSRCLPLVSCEHGGNRVPERYRPRFYGATEALDSHRGWDPGALPFARALARELDAPLRYSLTSRLLVDPNRSGDSPNLWSPWSGGLSPREKRRVLAEYHIRHRKRVDVAVRERISQAPVLHLGIHTFTPVWEGVPRSVQVGILFDSERVAEARAAHVLLEGVARSLPHLVVRPNEPYLGVDDGLTTTLRARFPEEAYLGIEVEVAQPLALDADTRIRIVGALAEAARPLLVGRTS